MKTTKSLQEVWDMKQAAYEETRELRGASYFNHIHRRVEELLPVRMKLRRITARPHPGIAVAKVAETPAKYSAKRPTNAPRRKRR